MDIFQEFINLFRSYFIEGIFISVLVLIFTRRILHHKIDTFYAVKFIKWSLITYSIASIIYLLLSLLFEESFSLINRAIGPYWWAFWLQLVNNLFLPLLLLSKKFANKIHLILIISILMNMGMLFELYVIQMTSLYRDYVTGSHYMFFDREILILLKGLSLGAFALIVGRLLKKYKIAKNEMI